MIAAWAQAWAALNLAPVFAALDAHALQVPCEVSKATDKRTRALQKAVIEGVLSVPEQQLATSGGLDELTRLFSKIETARELMPATAAQGQEQYPAAFTQACRAVDAIEGMADFLFAALSVPRPAGMGLAAFLQVGMHLRRQAGIDGLERVLMQTPGNHAQEALRGHALQALRRAQQRLLAQVLQQDGKADAVGSVLGKLKLNGSVGMAQAQPSLENAVLEVWALSEAASSAMAVAPMENA